ncbi:Methionine aminopeptidase 1D, mitochondrial [Eumeta japonica]|uniref:Methionine aminopeptidase 1D, mitochondrial n=1 Tax=Eumeta variegata TaxID=151549 RepID=A0A4C1XZ04_EUMVA|nr:Methionine aminopeptidase 1D, mitochondrial [Eumeta japonica]
METTSSRLIPEHIQKPDYVLNKAVQNVERVQIKDINQIRGMRRSCKLAANILDKVQKFVEVGITTDAIDELVHNLSVEANAYPSPLHYKGFPKSVCTSVNNVAVHGIPDLRPLHDGDIVNVDITAHRLLVEAYNEAALSERTCHEWFQKFKNDDFDVEDKDRSGRPKIYVDAELEELLEENLSQTQKELALTLEAIKSCGPDVPFCTIGSLIQRHAKRNRLTVCPAFLGHGIGEHFHEPPEIYHVENRYPGLMKPGMTFTIEPVLTHGNEYTYILNDGWTVITADGARTAQWPSQTMQEPLGTQRPGP